MPSDGTERDLTPGEKLKAQFAGWTRRTAFYVLTNERDAQFFDLYRYDAKTTSGHVVYQNDDGYLPDDVRDGSGSRWPSQHDNDNDLYLWSEASSETKHITPHTGKASTPGHFDPVSTYLYFLTNDGCEFTRCAATSWPRARTKTSRSPTGTSPLAFSKAAGTGSSP